MRVLFVKKKVAKRAIYEKVLLKKRLKIFFIRNEGKLCGTYVNFAFLHPPRDNLNTVSSYTNYLQEIKTDGNGRTDCLKVDDSEKLEKLNILSVNVFELLKDKTLCHISVSEKRNEIQDEIEASQQDN